MLRSVILSKVVELRWRTADCVADYVDIEVSHLAKTCFERHDEGTFDAVWSCLMTFLVLREFLYNYTIRLLTNLLLSSSEPDCQILASSLAANARGDSPVATRQTFAVPHCCLITAYV